MTEAKKSFTVSPSLGTNEPLASSDSFRHGQCLYLSDSFSVNSACTVYCSVLYQKNDLLAHISNPLDPILCLRHFAPKARRQLSVLSFTPSSAADAMVARSPCKCALTGKGIHQMPTFSQNRNQTELYCIAFNCTKTNALEHAKSTKKTVYICVMHPLRPHVQWLFMFKPSPCLPLQSLAAHPCEGCLVVSCGRQPNCPLLTWR